MQFSIAVRNARADAIESTTGASAILTIRTGAAPANCAAANTGTVLATVTLPADWMAAASAGAKALAGTWQDTAADATGAAAHWRIHDSTGATCHIQGTCGLSAADMILDSLSFTAGQAFNVTTFAITEGNA